MLELVSVKGDRAIFYISYYLVLYKTSWEIIECTFYLNMRGYSKVPVIYLPTAVHFTHNVHLERFWAQFVGGVVEWGNVWPQLTYFSFFLLATLSEQRTTGKLIYCWKIVFSQKHCVLLLVDLFGYPSGSEAWICCDPFINRSSVKTHWTKLDIFKLITHFWCSNTSAHIFLTFLSVLKIKDIQNKVCCLIVISLFWEWDNHFYTWVFPIASFLYTFSIITTVSAET